MYSLANEYVSSVSEGSRHTVIYVFNVADKMYTHFDTNSLSKLALNSTKSKLVLVCLLSHCSLYLEQFLG